MEPGPNFWPGDLTQMSLTQWLDLIVERTENQTGPSVHEF